MEYTSHYDSPLGGITLASDGNALLGLWFDVQKYFADGRHLLRETFSDRKEMDEDDVHRSDTMAERMSLSDRFGVTIGYYKPQRQEYFQIVSALAESFPELSIEREELLKKADQWAMRHGGMSGRTAKQFVDDMVSQMM